jgi:hypothetical protein
VSQAFTASIALMMEAVSIYETFNFYETTRPNIPEDSHLHNAEVIQQVSSLDFYPVNLTRKIT